MSALLLEQGMTISDVRQRLAAAFRAQRLDSPELDARLIIGHALRLDFAALIGNAQKLTSEEAERIAVLARRRVAHEPMARIAGFKEFWSLRLQLNDRVLVPRADSETVVVRALAAITAMPKRPQPLRIADLGTGSGALLLALAHELPGVLGVGTDRSERTVMLARENARHLGLSARAHFIVGDYGSALAPGFDLVVSNPPYIPTHEIVELAREVRDYDPHLALDGGLDGLDGMRAIAADAGRLLRPGGTIVVEIGAGQSKKVAAIFSAAGLSVDGIRPDLAGIPRALSAVNPCRQSIADRQKTSWIIPRE